MPRARGREGRRFPAGATTRPSLASCRSGQGAAKDAAWLLKQKRPGSHKRSGLYAAREAPESPQEKQPDGCDRGGLFSTKEAAWCL